MKVARKFEGKFWEGEVTRYMILVEEDDVELWQVKYDDGDKEQMDKVELLEGIEKYTKNASVTSVMIKSSNRIPGYYIQRMLVLVFPSSAQRTGRAMKLHKRGKEFQVPKN